MDLRLHFAASTLITASAVLAIGWFGFTSNRRAKLNGLWAAHNATICCWAIGQTVHVLTSSARVADLAIRLCYVTGVFWIPTLFLHLSLVLCCRRDLKALAVAYGFSALCCMQVMSHLVLGSPRVVSELGFYTAPGRWYPAFLAVWGGILLYGLYAVLYAVRREHDALRRRRLRLFLWFSTIGFAGGLCNFLPVFGVIVWPYTPYGTYAVPIYALIAAYAMLRYQLLDTYVVIRRGLVYSLLIAYMTGLYLVMVLIVEQWFQGFLGYRSLVGSAVVAFVVAVFFNPIRERIQGFVDRWLFKATPVELADQRERLLGELQKSEQSKAVATLAAGLAHEIRNPLATIKTFTDYLPAHGQEPAYCEKFHRIVGAEIERINAIAQRLLDFAKPSPPALAPVEIVPLIDQTLEFLGGELMQRRVQVIRRFDAQGVVLGDAQQLKQVLLNLLLNSLQAVNGHGRLEISTSRRDSRLEVSICDNGCGIAAEHLRRIFEPFFTTKATGTGLGLSVVQNIVAEHSARITVESRLNAGTRVTLSFPAVQADHAACV